MSCWRTIALSLISAVLFFAPDTSSSAETKIITDTGQEHVGDVISAGVNTLTIKLNSSGYQIVPVKSIAWITVDLADGSPIEGNFIDWSNGEMIVRVGDRDVGVSNGIITSVIDVGVAAGGPKLSAPPPLASEAPPPAAEAPPLELEPEPFQNAPAPQPQPEHMPTNATM